MSTGGATAIKRNEYVCAEGHHHLMHTGGRCVEARCRLEVTKRPVEYVRADLHRGAVDALVAEVARLQAALMEASVELDAAGCQVAASDAHQATTRGQS